MKKITLSLFSLLLILGLKAQNCQEIFVSEVIFSRDSINTTYLENYSLELYNPTDVDILLSDYYIKLTPQIGNPTFIYLTDTIHPKGTYVITKVGSSLTLTAAARMLSSSLDFDNFVTIELYKEDNLIDRIGNFGLTNPDDVDIIQAMANPANYLNGLNIDLRSLENLVFRRNPMIGKGNINFDNLSLEWYVQPNNDFTDIDKHTNICKENDVIVEFASDTYTTVEGKTVFPSIQINNCDNSLLPNIIVHIMKKSIPPFAILPIYYVDIQDKISPTSATLQGGNSNQFEVWSVEDTIVEEDEVIMYEIVSAWGAKINPAKKYTTITFTNNDAHKQLAGDIGIQNVTPKITIYPNPANDFINIKNIDNQTIESIKIIDIMGKEVFKSNENKSKISITKFSSGQYIILIEANNQITTHKFIKN